MNYLEDPGKRSGRTTRMMYHAAALAAQGRAVYVCALDRILCSVLERFRRENFPRATGIQFDTPEKLDIDWDSMTLRGAHPNCVLLVDHSVILQRFGRVLQMYHQYSEDGTVACWDRAWNTNIDNVQLPPITL